MSTIRALWDRARAALATAQRERDLDYDAAASRACYAAFHAVSALFLPEGRTFRRHTALEAAVHRDLVAAGRWPRELGADFSRLQRLRTTGDYGGDARVEAADVAAAIAAAERILAAVHAVAPEELPLG